MFFFLCLTLSLCHILSTAEEGATGHGRHYREEMERSRYERQLL